jgi:hypothetical protein
LFVGLAHHAYLGWRYSGWGSRRRLLPGVWGAFRVVVCTLAVLMCVVGRTGIVACGCVPAVVVWLALVGFVVVVVWLVCVVLTVLVFAGGGRQERERRGEVLGGGRRRRVALAFVELLCAVKCGQAELVDVLVELVELLDGSRAGRRGRRWLPRWRWGWWARENARLRRERVILELELARLRSARQGDG